MPEKKRARSTPISDSEILAMYETVLPLLYHTQNGLDASGQIKLLVRAFIPFDYYHYALEIASTDQGDPRLMISLVKPERLDHAKPALSPSETFDEMVEHDYQNCVEEFHEKYGDRQKFDYYRILSQEDPKIAVGLFRCIDGAGHNSFTKHDKQVLDRLAPHIFRLYRIVMLLTYRSENIQYLGMFTRLASKMANDHQLSGSEVRLIPDILLGYNNEAIADKHFISVETVKTHIKHILKKTGTKNRVDFIGKFFTSPDRMQL